MTDPDERALLAAVLAAPADDLPRLVFADWLTENGEPEYGDFIRVQVEIARPFAAACNACGRPLGDDRVADGCPCNSPRGVNHGIIPAYVCTCPECDPAQTGSVRARPATVHALREQEWNLVRDHGHRWALQVMPGCGRTMFSGSDPAVTAYLPGGAGVRLLFRRGFGAGVRLPLAAWLGEPCENCDGDGEFTRQNSDGPPGPCPDCGGKWNSGPHCDADSYWDRGTGYVGGVAAAVCGSQPVERVTPSDREPEDGPSGWSWFKIGFADDPATLPEVLFDRLEGECSPSMLGQRLTFPTRRAALDALSAAALAVGRERARIKG